MAWRVAASLLTLRDQVNAAWPNRSRLSDGTIGDDNHKKKGFKNSDRNPWVTEGNLGIVRALDITHDPDKGCDSGKIAKAIVASQDARVAYVIWDRKIANSSAVGSAAPWTWRAYGGANPHNHHCHISVKTAKSHYDSTAAWAIKAPNTIGDPMVPDITERPLLKRLSRGEPVKELQKLLNKKGNYGLKVDGGFGENTENAVKDFQGKAKLFVDGKVGSQTWAALLS